MARRSNENKYRWSKYARVKSLSSWGDRGGGGGSSNSELPAIPETEPPPNPAPAVNDFKKTAADNIPVVYEIPLIRKLTLAQSSTTSHAEAVFLLKNPDKHPHAALIKEINDHNEKRTLLLQQIKKGKVILAEKLDPEHNRPIETSEEVKDTTTISINVPTPPESPVQSAVSEQNDILPSSEEAKDSTTPSFNAPTPLQTPVESTTVPTAPVSPIIKDVASEADQAAPSMDGGNGEDQDSETQPATSPSSEASDQSEINGRKFSVYSERGRESLSIHQEHFSPDKKHRWHVTGGFVGSSIDRAIPEHTVIKFHTGTGLLKCCDHLLSTCPFCPIAPSPSGHLDAPGETDLLTDTRVGSLTTAGLSSLTLPVEEESLLSAAQNPDEAMPIPQIETRFIPQWDIELNGRSAIIGIVKRDYSNPDKPEEPSSFDTFCCSECNGLTWLVGRRQQAGSRSHPSHHTSLNEKWYQGATDIPFESGTTRSLVVQIAAGPPTKGSPYEGAGVGVYFGKNSVYNYSHAVHDEELNDHDGVPYSQLPYEDLNGHAPLLCALAAALYEVRDAIAPDRKALIKALGNSNSEHAKRKAMRFRLIIQTNAEWLVDLFTRQIDNTVVVKHLPDPGPEPEKAAEEPEEDKAAAKAKRRAAKKTRQKAAKKAQKANGDAPDRVEDEAAGCSGASEEAERMVQVYWDKKGKVVPNNPIIRGILDRIDDLRQYGVTVVFYHVPAKYVKEAQKLANEAGEPKQGLPHEVYKGPHFW